jgi:hypothetical protein
MESKKINQLATELAPALSDLTIIGDPTTGISKKITLSQMASLFTGTVEEYANLAAFPLVGVADTIYIALDTNVLYRWDTGTNAYVELSPNIINSLVFNDANGFDGTISLVGSVATLTITTALTTGSVGFIGASGALLQDNANFFWDDSNNRLGLGTNAPTTAIDVFGSGIIGRLNGTSTNNAFLGFANAGTNRWSIGNVQSDHRFRIYNEAATSELFTILPTGEIGIGIANPFANLHIDGGASVNRVIMDANINVAKIFSFRSDNSPRWALRVDGTESGSNAGADFAIRRYTDAGAFIDAPLSITRSNGNIGIGGASGSDKLTITGSFRTDLGASGTSAIFTGTGSNFQINHDGTSTVNLINTGGGGYVFKAGNATTSIFTLSNAGAATFLSTITATQGIFAAQNGNSSDYNYLIFNNLESGYGDWNFYKSGSNDLGIGYGTSAGSSYTNAITLKYGGNLGIGTIDPQSPLHIIKALGNVAISIGESGTNQRLKIGQESSYTGNYIDSTNIDLKLLSNLSGGSGGNIIFLTGSSGVNTERVRINSVGILAFNGSSSPNSAGIDKLSIGFENGVDGWLQTWGGRPLSLNSQGNNVLIGTRTDNGGKLQVRSGNTGESTAHIQLGTADFGGFHWLDGTAYWIGQNSNFRQLRVYSGSNIYTGVLLSAGGSSWGAYSDERMKTDLIPIENALDKISQLRTVIGRYKTDEIDKKRSFLIAQDVIKVLPEAVSINNDEINSLTVQYTDIIPLLTAAIKEIQIELNEIKNK